jgi:hypothetical protein
MVQYRYSCCASAAASSGGQADDQTLHGDELIAVSK